MTEPLIADVTGFNQGTLDKVRTGLRRALGPDTPDQTLIDCISDMANEGILFREDAEEKGEASDGSHTFDELYEHRRALTGVLATIGAINGDSWRSKQHHPDDGPMFDDHFIVGISLPDGVITYHYALEHWDRFAAVPELERAPKWDGANANDTVLRLDAFTRHLKAAIDEGRAVQGQAREAADAVVVAAAQPVGATDPYDADGQPGGGHSGSPREAFDPDQLIGPDDILPEVQK